MNDSERYITSGVFSHERAKEQPPVNDHQVNQSGNCVIEGCPCRGWSAQETAGTVVCKEGGRPHPHTMYCNHTDDADDIHQPAARGGGDEWEAIRSQVGSYIWRGKELVASCGSPDAAEPIVAALSQHQSLVAERERLIVAAKAVVERLADLPRYLEKNGTDTLATMTAECLADLAVAIPAEQRSTSE